MWLWQLRADARQQREGTPSVAQTESLLLQRAVADNPDVHGIRSSSTSSPSKAEHLVGTVPLQDEDLRVLTMKLCTAVLAAILHLARQNI